LIFLDSFNLINGVGLLSNILLLLGKSRGKHRKNLRGETLGRLNAVRQESNPYKGMTPPSIQNLKALSLWVFFFICFSTFSFLLNVGLRLALGYLTISPSSETPSSTLVHSPSSGSIFKYEYLTHKRSSLILSFTHLNETRLPETSVRKTFDTWIKLYSS